VLIDAMHVVSVTDWLKAMASILWGYNARGIMGIFSEGVGAGNKVRVDRQSA